MMPWRSGTEGTNGRGPTTRLGWSRVSWGALGFYAPGWDYRKGPVQLTALLPNASGVEELADFRCFMFGDAGRARVDLVQSFEVDTWLVLSALLRDP